MLKNLAHPRKRSVSVGPQSAADAYETLAYRNRRRRESINSLDGAVPEDAPWSPTKTDNSPANLKPPPKRSDNVPLGTGLLPTPMASRVHSYEHMMGSGPIVQPSITPPESDTDFAGEAVPSPEDEAKEKREIFMQLTKPRVRYDVEVVTKLIIYTGTLKFRPEVLADFTGIAWLAVEGNPIFFEHLGLGMGVRP